MPRRAAPLNASRLASLKPPPAGRLEMYDGACDGLSFRLSASGAAVWSFKFWNKADGRQERLALGSYPALSLGRARDLAAKARAQLADGVNPAAQIRARQDVLRFDEAAASYLAYLDSIAKPSRANDRSCLVRPRAAWGRVALDRIDRRAVAELTEDVGRDHPRTANAILTALKGFFAWAVDRAGHLRESPVAGMRPLFKTGSRERVLSAAEIEALWQATAPESATFDRDVSDVLRLALLTGQRSGQLRDLRRNEVRDLDGPAPRLAWVAERMKAGKAQSIPLVGEALRIVHSALQRHPGEALFGLGKHTLSRAVSTFLGPAAGGWTPHDLRRTHLTLAAELGISDAVRDAIAAHSSGVRSVYDRYSRLAELSTGFAAIERRITGALDDAVVPLHGRRQSA